jgi:hypothetical protein
MLKFLKALKDFFSSLLMGNTEEVKKKRELKKIFKEIKQHKPLFYKQSTGQILPQFARTLLTFVQYLRPLKELIYKTILHENERLAEKYKEYLIEFRLEEKMQLKKQNFTYDSIKARLFNTVSLKTETEILNKEFADFLNLFSGPEFSTFDSEFTALEHFISLCQHDFIRLLMYFDPDISLSPAYKPHLSPCIGYHANQDLMDLYFIFAELDMSVGIDKNLLFLLKRLKKNVTEVDELKIKKIVSAMATIYKKYLSPEILLNMLRAINADPYFTMKTDTSTKSYLDVYRGKLSSRFQRDLEKVTRECTEKEILKDLSHLFDENDLIEIEGYTEDMAKMLQAESFNSFSYTKPLKILKSFTVYHFESRIQETVKKIVISGFFENKKFKERFINIFHAAQGIKDAILDFEHTITATGEVSINKIRKYLVDFKKGKSVAYSLNKLIETLNNMAIKIIEDNTNTYYALQEVISEIIGDAKQRAPALISNIKVIGGEKNQELWSNLLESHKLLLVFTEIMKNFTIIRPHIDKEQLQEPPEENELSKEF